MPARPLRVLIVEDHVDLLKAFGLALEMLGHEVELANDAGSALSRARQTEFDVLIADARLPGVDGWQLLGKLQAEGYRPPFAVSMSTPEAGGEAARSAAAGYDAYLQQPFKLAELEAVLAAAAVRASGQPAPPEERGQAAPASEEDAIRAVADLHRRWLEESAALRRAARLERARFKLEVIRRRALRERLRSEQSSLEASR